MITVLKNARIFDGFSEDILEGTNVIIENDRIKELTERPSYMENTVEIDCQGNFLMPGMIDAHFHAYTPSFNILANDHMPPALMTSHAIRILEGSLKRGFTTVRDAAGGDIGLWLAIEQGLIQGPRFFFSGKALSQTGGHGDIRPADHVDPCACGSYSGSISRVADGADAMRAAVREELRKGAHQIKIFVSGGGVSPTDPMWMPQFTEDEIRAAVYEASTRRTYVMAHCHTDEGAKRCADYGVRTIEHGTFIGSETAQYLAQKEVYVVPTLSVVDVLQKHGPSLGLPPMAIDKIKSVGHSMLDALDACSRAGVKLGLGADLLGHDFHPLQGGELELRSAVNRPIDILRSATSVNAEIIQKSGELGCIKPDAYADLLLVRGDPLKNLGLLRNSDKNIPIIIKGGVFVKHDL